MSPRILLIPKGNVSVHDLKPITALGGTTAQVDVVAGVTLRENPGLALASVAARITALPIRCVPREAKLPISCGPVSLSAVST